MSKGSGRGRKKTVRKKARRRRSKQTEEGDKYHMWGRRRDGLTNNFTLAVYMQFLVAADRFEADLLKANQISLHDETQTYRKSHEAYKALSTVRRETLSSCATATMLSPCSLSLQAWATCCADRSGLQPIFTPRALAAADRFRALLYQRPLKLFSALITTRPGLILISSFR